MKFCRWCEQTKTLEEFYPHARMADGRLNKCKDCVMAYERQRRATDPSVQDRERARYHDGKKASSRVWAAANTERSALSRQASQVVRRAVQSGKIQKADACQRCGIEGIPLEGAHSDYARPLDVEWLCRRCHRRWDSAQPKTKSVA